MRASEFINESVKLAEGLENIPATLYHATYRPLLKSIKTNGLGGDKAQAKWEDSKPGVVYLAFDKNVAESYAETSDVVPDEWLDKIIILKISTSGLDKTKFGIDRNVQDNVGDTVEYHGVIPVSNISLVKQGVAEERLDEVPLPPDWDPEQLNLRQTFKNRLKYALDRAKRLGGGSSRVAMTIEYEGRPTALKVAKNLKGLAQNEAEIEILDDGYLGNLPIIIPLIDYDKANKRPVWLQTEIAKKVTKPTLIKLLHSPNMYLFVSKVKSILGQPGALVDKQIKTIYFRSEKDWNPTEKDWETFNEYASEVADLVGQSKLDVGDLPNPANWGIFNNRPVIIDLGFTSDTKSLYGFKE